MNQEEQWLLTEKYRGVESEAFHADLVLLNSGTPLGYLIGTIPFLNCVIHLDSQPLIPRTETEFWTEKAIEAIQKNELKQSYVLDLCAGSGAIGVAVAKSIPGAHVTFSEIDSAHLPTIQKNIDSNLQTATSSRSVLEQQSDTEKRISVVQSDLFAALPKSADCSSTDLERLEGGYDFILTNPPYIDPALDRTETSVKMHEPHLALYGGTDGMECIVRIIAETRTHLSSNGQLWIEHEPEQSEAIAILGKEAGFTTTTHKDQYGIERYTVLQ
ncbi:MAG: release factor glutamine methyltransferase [Patiriisocius sp.]|jgi:release factor glutamine methyltransferase